MVPARAEGYRPAVIRESRIKDRPFKPMNDSLSIKIELDLEVEVYLSAADPKWHLWWLNSRTNSALGWSVCSSQGRCHYRIIVIWSENFHVSIIATGRRGGSPSGKAILSDFGNWKYSLLAVSVIILFYFCFTTRVKCSLFQRAMKVFVEHLYADLFADHFNSILRPFI